MRQVRLSDHVYSGIVELIREQGLEVGQRLPSEARLGDMLGVSRAVVREALMRLASDGITEARRGSGSFVKSRPSHMLTEFMPMDSLPGTLGSYEVRFVLEAEAARLAATRRTMEDMAAVEEGMARLRSALQSSQPAHQEDMDLHRQIAIATGNPAFIAAYDALFEDVDRIMRAGVDISRSRSPDVIATILREHELIVDAIRAQDAEGAALAMRWHLWEGRRRLMP